MCHPPYRLQRQQLAPQRRLASSACLDSNPPAAPSGRRASLLHLDVMGSCCILLQPVCLHLSALFRVSLC